jgi:hypothetical protein
MPNLSKNESNVKVLMPSTNSLQMQMFPFTAISNSIQMWQMQMTRNSKSTICRALQQVQEHELLSRHSTDMQMLQFDAI